MKQLKKLLALCLVLATLLGVLPTAVMAADVVDSGEYTPGNGSRVSWVLDSNGILTVKGNGGIDKDSATKEYPWRKYSSQTKKIVIGEGFTSIGEHAFEINHASAVSLPDGLKYIGKDAFSYCEEMTSINLPDSLKRIEDGAFYRIKVPTIILPASLEHIGKSAFGESKISKVVFPAGIKKIDDGAFALCGDLKSVTIPETVTRIGDGAFSEAGLSSIIIPRSVVNVGENAFSWCPLTNVTIQNGVRSIGTRAFNYCPNLTHVTIPKSVLSIGYQAFGYYPSGRSGDDSWTSNDKVKNFTISGYTGTAAEIYAKGYGISFNALDQKAAPAKLATPAISKVENVNGGVKLTWGKVSGAAKYRVFVKNGSKWVTLGDTAKTSFVWKKAKSGTKYTFTVRCVSADGKSYVSAYNKTGKTIRYIAAPVLSKVQNTKQGVQVTWKKSAGAVKYRIFRKTASGWKRIGDTNKLFFVDKTAKKGVKYTYTVRCTSANGKTFTSSYDAKGKSIKR